MDTARTTCNPAKAVCGIHKSMDAIRSLFTGAMIADIVIAVMVIEAMVLVWNSRQGHANVSCKLIMAALLPGFFLALALRAALVQAHWIWLAFTLLGALITHFIDMRLRYQQRTPSSPAR